METQQRRLRRSGRSRSLGSLQDRLYPDDRENLQVIIWKPLSHDADDRNDPKVSQNARLYDYSKIQQFNALSALRSKQNARFPSNPILHYAYSSLLKENNSAINRLPLRLFGLFYRTPAKIMLPPQAQTVQYRFLRRSRRLYGNQKSPLSCRSSGSLKNIFETIGTIRTIKWKPGFR